MHQLVLRFCHCYSDNKVLYIVFLQHSVLNNSSSPGQDLHAACPVHCLYFYVSYSQLCCRMRCKTLFSVHGLFTISLFMSSWKMLWALYVGKWYHLKKWKLSRMFVQNTLPIILVTTALNDATKSGLRLYATRYMQVIRRLLMTDDVQIDCVNATVWPLVCLCTS